MKRIKDWLALWFILAARRLTSWGFVDDHLAEAERILRLHLKDRY